MLHVRQTQKSPRLVIVVTAILGSYNFTLQHIEPDQKIRLRLSEKNYGSLCIFPVIGEL
jgi:hypothetical protein